MTIVNQEPPLITVTNPVTYFRLWWNKVMGKEGIDFKFKIHPVTAFLISFGLGAGIFGAGRYSVNIPFLKLEAIPTIKPAPIPELAGRREAPPMELARPLELFGRKE